MNTFRPKSGGRSPKLILVDGLPCSGKSSAAQFVHGLLLRHGIPARCRLEFQAVNAACLWKVSDRKKAVEAVLDQWRRFTAKALRSRRVTVMEPSWFQVTAGFLLLHDFRVAEIVEYAARAERILRPLRPRLIYLRAATAAEAWDRMRRYRPREWFRENNAFIAGLPFARSRGLRRGETLARFVEEAWRLGNLLFRKSSLRRLRLDVTGPDWAARYAKIARFLALPILRDEPPIRAELAKFAGVYDLGPERARLTVRLGNDGTLVARFRNWLPHVRLLPRKPRLFTLAGLPCELSFQLDRSGAVRSATAHGIPGWELSGKTFARRSGSGAGPAGSASGGKLRSAARWTAAACERETSNE